MFDHLSLRVKNFEAAASFYTSALAPLGYGCVRSSDGADRSAGFGRGKVLQFWISEGAKTGAAVHVAFSADDHKAVDSFYEQAIAAGGRDNGPPGLRSRYHESYYAAFVLDPDGNNVEVVCHFPGNLEDQFAAGTKAE